MSYQQSKMIQQIGIAFAAVYVLLALFAYKNVVKAFRKYADYKRVQCPESWKGFLRSDFGRWDEAKIKRGAFLKFPIHFMTMGTYFMFLMIAGLIYMKSKRVGKFCTLIAVNVFGVIAVKTNWIIKQQFSQEERKIQTPIVIANHVSWIDLVYLATYFHPVSFVAKKQVLSIPVVNAISIYLQCIYVERGSAEARKKTFQNIAQRVEDYQKSYQKQNQNTNADVYPLVIFPEGTTSNGRSILEFKAGAFQSLSEITLISLNYECDGFQMGMDEVNNAEHYFISACLTPILKVKKQKIKPTDGQTDEMYKERCRTALAKMTGFPIYDVSFKDIQQNQRLQAEIRSNRKIK